MKRQEKSTAPQTGAVVPVKKRRRKASPSERKVFSRRLWILVGFFTAVCLLFAAVLLVLALKDGYFVYGVSGTP